MEKVFEKWCSISLILRIVIGLVIGAVLGLTLPQFTVVSWLGTIFVGALRAVAPILVFILVMSSLANSKGGAGGNMKTVIVLYIASTLIASFLATFASFIFPQTMELTAAASNTAPEGIGEVIKNLLSNMVANPVASIVDGNYIGILTWAIVFGLALRRLASENSLAATCEYAHRIGGHIAETAC